METAAANFKRAREYLTNGVEQTLRPRHMQ